MTVFWSKKGSHYTLWIRRIEHRKYNRGCNRLPKLLQTIAPSIPFPVFNPLNPQGIMRSFFGPKNRHCIRNVTVTGVNVSREACTEIWNQRHRIHSRVGAPFLRVALLHCSATQDLRVAQLQKIVLSLL